MKVDKEKWESATANLMERRQWKGHADDNRDLDNALRDYKTHINKCGVGSSVLDVGCGSQTLKRCLPDGVDYIGIDAFPLDGLDIEPIAIESDEALKFKVDTVCAFAVLDNCRDFYKACDNMKKIAQDNIIILTGIGIDVDKYHTFKLEHKHFEEAFHDWDLTHKEELTPKVWLLCYQK